MSSIRSILEVDGTGFWPIDLATHSGTAIENETSLPRLALAGSRLRAETRYQKYTRIRDPIAGYNCFGHVLACRRTSINKPNIELIFCEDGIEEIDEKLVGLGDVVLYSDAEGPTHIARVSRFVTDKYGAKFPMVISKFDNVSGEYEHRLSDVNWDQRPYEISWRIYRERNRDPRKWQDWRSIVSG